MKGLMPWVWSKVNDTRLQSYTTFSCTTQLGMKFQLLLKTKRLKNNAFLASEHSAVVFIMLINVKMSTIVGILTFMSMINFMFIELSIKNRFYDLGPPGGHSFWSNTMKFTFSWISEKWNSSLIFMFFIINIGLFSKYLTTHQPL